MLKNQLLAGLAGVALLLGGCVEVDHESSGAASTEPVEMEGQATKGLLANALVSVYALEDGQRRFLAEAVTGPEGRFSVEFPAQSAPLVVEVSAAGDGSSTMVCDAPSGCGQAGFGDVTDMPAGLVLSSIVMPAEARERLVSVTPLTHLVAEMAGDLPEEIDGQSLPVLRSQLAQLIGLPADFAFRSVPDVTSQTAFDGAEGGDQLHAVMSAFFLEAAAQTGMPLPDVISGYRKRLLDNGGQLPVKGDFSMEWLLLGASWIADQIGSGPAQDLSMSLQTRLQSLSGDVTSATPGLVGTSTDLDRALVALDDLDHYLGLAGIDESGGFFAGEAHQVEWLYSQEMLALLEKTLASARAAIILSAIGDQLVAEQGNPLDVSGMFATGISAVYDQPAGTLTISGTADGQTLDIVLNITSLWTLQTSSQLDYAVSGSITNSEIEGTLDGTLSIDTHQTDFIPLLAAAELMLLEGGETNTQAFLDELAAMLPDLHASAVVDGQGSLVSVLDNTVRFDGAVSAWGEINLPNLDSAGDYLAFGIDSGSLQSPDGDRLFSHTDRAALDVRIGDTATMAADFGFEAFNVPEVHVEASGSLSGLSGLATDFNDILALQQSSGQLELSRFLDAILSVDPGILSLSGRGRLEIPADGLTYQFDLENNVLTASLPNSTEPALSFYLTGLNGGYIYSNGALVASVTFDWSRSGAVIHLVNGESRAYFLGPLTDIVPPEFINAVFQLLGLEAPYPA